MFHPLFVRQGKIWIRYSFYSAHRKYDRTSSKAALINIVNSIANSKFCSSISSASKFYQYRSFRMSNVDIFGRNVVLFCAVNVGFLRFPSLSACVRLKYEKYLDYRTNASLFNSV